MSWIQILKRCVPKGLRRRGPAEVSSDYVVIDRGVAEAMDRGGWQQDAVAAEQHSAYEHLLEELRQGRPREDFLAAAAAVRATGISHPSLLEVGCGSAYYGEVLERLLQGGLNYVGLDYSAAMGRVARDRYPATAFVQGDAGQLPFADRCFDVVMNGVSLMHLLNFEQAIAESARVSRGWCVFHTVPLLRMRATTFLRKSAYGGPTVEVIFNQHSLEGLFRAAGMKVREVFESIPYNLENILGEPTRTRTFLCRVKEGACAS